MAKDFDVTIKRDELAALAPDLLATLRKFVEYGQCRQNNAHERKSLAETFRSLSVDAVRKYPNLKLSHMFAKTIVVD